MRLAAVTTLIGSCARVRFSYSTSGCEPRLRLFIPGNVSSSSPPKRGEGGAFASRCCRRAALRRGAADFALAATWCSFGAATCTRARLFITASVEPTIGELLRAPSARPAAPPTLRRIGPARVDRRDVRWRRGCDSRRVAPSPSPPSAHAFLAARGARRVGTGWRKAATFESWYHSTAFSYCSWSSPICEKWVRIRVCSFAAFLAAIIGSTCAMEWRRAIARIRIRFRERARSAHSIGCRAPRAQPVLPLAHARAQAGHPPLEHREPLLAEP